MGPEFQVECWSCTPQSFPAALIPPELKENQLMEIQRRFEKMIFPP